MESEKGHRQVSTFLKALAKNNTKKRAGYVVPLIEEHLLLSDISEDRRDKMFHPSSLSGDFCPREWSLYNYHPEGYTVKEGSVEPRLGRIFGNGHGVHTRIQSYLIDHLWGLWRRQVGWDDLNDEPEYMYHRGFKPAGGGWRYMEVRLEHRPHRILGSTDGLLNIDGQKWGLEIKSINPDSYRFLTDRPKALHVNQVLIYEHALEWERTTLDTRGQKPVDAFAAMPLRGFIVVYENKGTQELKEFPVPYDAQQVETFMQSRLPVMDEALEYERSGEHPGCTCPVGKESALCKAFPDPDRFNNIFSSLVKP